MPLQSLDCLRLDYIELVWKVPGQDEVQQRGVKTGRLTRVRVNVDPVRLAESLMHRCGREGVIGRIALHFQERSEKHARPHTPDQLS